LKQTKVTQQHFYIFNIYLFFPKVLKETIKENGINLNFHKFKYQININKKNKVEERIIFTPINNTEISLNKSGINNLFEILSTKYDYVDYSVKTNLKHKIVFEEIERISKRKVSIPSQNERSKSFIMIDIFSSIQITKDNKNSLNPPNQEREDEEPFIEVSHLLKKINEKNELNEIFERDEIENILEDLHKLGMIVYFKKKSLNNTIISNPQWLNKVKKKISYNLKLSFIFFFFF
jgi:hypothetical protein